MGSVHFVRFRELSSFRNTKTRAAAPSRENWPVLTRFRMRSKRSIVHFRSRCLFPCARRRENIFFLPSIFAKCMGRKNHAESGFSFAFANYRVFAIRKLAASALATAAPSRENWSFLTRFRIRSKRSVAHFRSRCLFPFARCR